MMLRITGIIGLVMALNINLFSQQDHQEGHLVVIQESLVDTVLYHYEQLRIHWLDNPDHKAIPGYRIQIFFDSGLHSSDRARQAKDQFMAKYPNVQAYVSWKAPNYRVRIGDFKSRLEAESFLQSILSDYPNGWVVKDEINFPLIN